MLPEMRRRTLLERGWLGRVRRRYFWRRVLTLVLVLTFWVAVVSALLLVSR